MALSAHDVEAQRSREQELVSDLWSDTRSEEVETQLVATDARHCIVLMVSDQRSDTNVQHQS